MINEDLVLDRLQGRKEYLQNKLDQYEQEIAKIKNDIEKNNREIQEAEKKIRLSIYPQNVCFDIFGIDIGNDADKIKGFNYVLMQLSEREREAIEYKYANGYTLERIGGMFNVSKERVRQIIAKGCRKIRHIKLADYIVVGYEKTQKAMQEAEEKKRKKFYESMKLKYPLDYDLRECGFSTRALNCLCRSATTKNSGEITVGEAIETIYKYGYTIQNLGAKTAKEIEEKLGVKFPER